MSFYLDVKFLEDQNHGLHALHLPQFLAQCALYTPVVLGELRGQCPVAPRGHVEMPGDIFGYHNMYNLGGRCY